VSIRGVILSEAKDLRLLSLLIQRLEPQILRFAQDDDVQWNERFEVQTT
jgi:hypothetical protein